MANVSILGAALSQLNLLGPGEVTNSFINAENTFFTMTFADGTVAEWTGTFIYDANDELVGGNVTQFVMTNINGFSDSRIEITDLNASPLLTVDQVESGDLLGIVQIYLSGDDTFGYSAPTPGANDLANDYSLAGFDGNDSIPGSGGIETIFGGNGSDNLLGEGDNDVIYGGEGIVSPNDSADTILGGLGSDVIYGNGGNDSILGGASSTDTEDSADTIYGGAGDDYITGNAGDDVIYGNTGNDTLIGGLGNDTFVYVGNEGQDQIRGFEGAGADGGDIFSIASGINGTSIATAADVISAMVTDGTHAYIDTGSGTGILVLFGADLSANDISVTS